MNANNIKKKYKMILIAYSIILTMILVYVLICYFCEN